jgi:hypothetical protein
MICRAACFITGICAVPPAMVNLPDNPSNADKSDDPAHTGWMLKTAINKQKNTKALLRNIKNLLSLLNLIFKNFSTHPGSLFQLPDQPGKIQAVFVCHVF